MPDLSAATFARFAEEAITPVIIVLTDGWHSFRPERELQHPTVSSNAATAPSHRASHSLATHTRHTTPHSPHPHAQRVPVPSQIDVALARPHRDLGHQAAKLLHGLVPD